MIINHNLNAMNANRMVTVNSNNASKAMAQLSSGLRINSAADDAAGLAISEKMKGQINGLNQASSNAQDGISLTQTADGALSETTSVLQRMRELAVQSSNDTNTTADRTAIQTETTALTAQIDNIANTTQFNTKNLLNGGAGIQGTVTDGAGNALLVGQQVNVAGGAAGVKAGGTLDLTGVAAATTATTTISGSTTTLGTDISIGTNGAALKLNGVTVNIAANTTGSAIANAINAATGQSGVTATYTSADGTNAASLVLKSTGSGSSSSIDLKGIVATAGANVAGDTFGAGDGNVSVTSTTGSIAAGTASLVTGDFGSKGADATATIAGGTTGVAPTSSSSSGNTITMHGGDYDGLQLQVDSSKTSGAVDVKIDANNSLTMQIGANQGQTMNISIASMTSNALGVSALDLTTQTGAENAITSIDNATAMVSNTRAQLGAYQNRLQSTINSLGTTSQNLSSAQSSIADVDMAATMAEFSKDNIESQAAQAMISQANQQPQQVLQLLR